MTGVPLRRGRLDTGTERGMPSEWTDSGGRAREDRGGDRSGASAAEEPQGWRRHQQSEGVLKGPLRGASERPWPYRHLDFRLLPPEL